MSKSFKKTLGVILAIVFAGIVVFVSMQLWAPAKYKPLNWGKHEQVDKTADLVAGNMIVNGGEINGLSLAGRTLSAEEYAANGVSESAENAVKIQVSLVPENTTDTDITTALSFVNAGSEWANGKEVSDYVTATLKGYEITVTCHEAFGEQIVLRIDTEKPDIFATISLDYLKQVTSVEFGLQKGGELVDTVVVGDNATYTVVPFNVEYTTGTVAPDIVVDMCIYTVLYNNLPYQYTFTNSFVADIDFNKNFYFSANPTTPITRENFCKAVKKTVQFTMSAGTYFNGGEKMEYFQKNINFTTDVSAYEVPLQGVNPDKDNIIFS